MTLRPALAFIVSVIALVVATVVLVHSWSVAASSLPARLGLVALVAILLFVNLVQWWIASARSASGEADQANVQRGAALLEAAVPATKRAPIRPLQDRVLVKRLTEDGTSRPGTIIPDTAKEKPGVGEVIATGVGRVAEGDKIVFGKYSGSEIQEAGEDLLILKEEDILEILDPGDDQKQAQARPQAEPEPPPAAAAAPPEQPAPHHEPAAERPLPRASVSPAVLKPSDALLSWVTQAPLAASQPLQPSAIPRLVPSSVVPISPAQDVPPDTVRLFYGTDRARKFSPRGVTGYSWRRARRVEYGVCWVSIPPGDLHQVGRMEGPSWFKLQFRANPQKHVTLHEIAPIERELWFEQVGWMTSRVRAKQLLIFVHGYNVTFKDAARRTGQFVYDLEFPGVPMFYSWPSCGSTLLYTFDEAAVQNAEGHLQSFIEGAVGCGDFESVFLVAHSMGNRVMTAAIERVISKTKALGGRIKHLILAAPDIDAGYFTDTLAPSLLALGLKMTMYVSSHDRALAASRWFHGWPRLGDANKGIVVIPGIDTIDASNVDTSFLGHSPFSDRRELLNDINSLMKGNAIGNRYGFDRLAVGGAAYYRFKK
jgi:esterase/lipase superfamily enzyme/co-chaperonin GroES (HSP10)